MAHLQLLKSKSKSLSSAEASEKEEESARGTMGRGKKEERHLPYNVRFSSGWHGFAVLWFWLNQPTILDGFERCCEDNSIKG